MVNYSFSEETTAKYVSQYLENSQKISYLELDEKNKLETVLYKDLPDTEVKGYPIASDYVDKNGKIYSVSEFDALPAKLAADCELRFHFLPNYHELYVGTTGSGKTTGCMEPQLRAISSQKNKPNIFITDPKGELFEHNARHLRKNGYKTFILNFKDFSMSDNWNPLLEMYEQKMIIESMGKDCKMHTGKPLKGLILYGHSEDFDEGGYIEYDGKAFPTPESFDYYVTIQKDALSAKVSSLVNQFACQAISVESVNDKTWEQGAQNLLKGILLCMLADAANKDSGFTKKMMTLKTLQDYYNRLRNDFVGECTYSSLESHWLLKDKPRVALDLMRTVLLNAPNTMRSYCGVYEGKMKDWTQGHIYTLTTGNSIDLEGDNPFAIFIATRDYDKSDYNIAGLFIDWVYRKVLVEAENSVKTEDNKPSTRAMHFMLDEFGNIPKIIDFENKIATARSRNIWFHLFVQSYEQLNLVYGSDMASVIKDNCNSQIFLGSQSRKTKETFSSECGKKWVPSIESYFNPVDRSLAEVAVVPVSDLDLICEGQIYTKRLYSPVILSQFIRSYKCAKQGAFNDFKDKTAIQDLAPLNITSYNSKEYVYGKLFESRYKTTEFDF